MYPDGFRTRFPRPSVVSGAFSKSGPRGSGTDRVEAGTIDGITEGVEGVAGAGGWVVEGAGRSLGCCSPSSGTLRVTCILLLSNLMLLSTVTVLFSGH